MSEPFYVLQNAETFDSIYIARVEGGRSSIVAEVKARGSQFKTIDLAEMLRRVLNSSAGE